MATGAVWCLRCETTWLPTPDKTAVHVSHTQYLQTVQKKKTLLALTVLAAAVALVGWTSWDSSSSPQIAKNTQAGTGGSGSASPPASNPGLSNKTAATVGSGGPFSAAGLATRQQQLAVWQERHERAEQVYNSYRDATRYPHESRPITEHPDQVRPFDPVTETKTLRDASGKPVKGLRLRTSQERVFVSGNESVTFTIAAFDDNNKPVTLTVSQSSAQAIPDTTTPITPIQTQVPFSDNGTGPDVTASDGSYSARLTPSAQGFANYAGTIRLLAQVTANGQQGVAHFDVTYAPAVPATWQGVREAIEGGSLNFYLKVQVQVAGRYVASGRVYDANGKPFALLQFNDQLAVGATELKLQLFGALLHDKNPPFPLKLVDVEGFLLRPDTFPDRFMMARQIGVVHTSGRYAVDRFSSTEWKSEERDRYLNEYGRDVQEAQERITSLQP